MHSPIVEAIELACKSVEMERMNGIRFNRHMDIEAELVKTCAARDSMDENHQATARQMGAPNRQLANVEFNLSTKLTLDKLMGEKSWAKASSRAQKVAVQDSFSAKHAHIERIERE